jgi:hypothetical protein
MLHAAREVRAVLRGATPTHRHLRQRLGSIGVATLGVAIASAVAAYYLERHAPRTEITSFWSALFWTSTQLLTVSSQIKNPISPGAHVLDVFLEGYAITVVATLAGSFGAFFHKRTLERGDS